MTITPGSTVVFAGDSITDCQRLDSEDGLGYPLRIAGEHAFRHPDRRVTWLNTATSGSKVMDLEARWQDVLDARPDWAADGIHPTPAGHAALAAAWLRLMA